MAGVPGLAKPEQVRMTRPVGPAMAASIRELRQRIDRWRCTRQPRTAMPAEFQAEAVALVRAGRASGPDSPW